MSDSEVKKVKLTGSLWTIRNVLAIARDVLLIIFLIVGIGLLFTLSSALASVAGSLQGVLSLPNMAKTIQEQGPQGVISEIQKDINSDNWDAALAKVNAVEVMMQQSDAPSESYQEIQQLKTALAAHNKPEIEKLLSQFSGNTK